MDRVDEPDTPENVVHQPAVAEIRGSGVNGRNSRKSQSETAHLAHHGLLDPLRSEEMTVYIFDETFQQEVRTYLEEENWWHGYRRNPLRTWHLNVRLLIWVEKPE